MLAAFLSNAPYLSYRNKLTDLKGYLTIWGHQQAQQSDGSPTVCVRELIDTGFTSHPLRHGRGLQDRYPSA